MSADSLIQPSGMDQEVVIHILKSVGDDVLSILKETGEIFINHGILPYPGGWLQQPRWWAELMQLVYLPGMNKAKYDHMKPEEKAMFHAKPVRRVIPEGREW